jgi:hypothetical protein
VAQLAEEFNPYESPSLEALESAAEYRRWWTWTGEWAEFRFPTEPARACRMFRRHGRFKFTIHVEGERAARPPCSLLSAPDIHIDGHILHFVGNLLTGRIDLRLDGKVRLRTVFPLLRIYAPLVWLTVTAVIGLGPGIVAELLERRF